MSKKSLVIKQTRSEIGRKKSHKSCLIGLGVRKLHKPVTVETTPENIGMITKVSYLVDVEDIQCY
jgi:large subunit ribosomal protein L30